MAEDRVRGPLVLRNLGKEERSGDKRVSSKMLFGYIGKKQ
jgi:hypothetical protein